MKKILISLSIIAVAAAIVVGASTAYFSDTETSPGNVIKAGSLDLTLDGYNNPTHAVVTIDDMKPCLTRYSAPITLEVFNNPGDLYKKIICEGSDQFCCETNGITEPECDDQGGQWGYDKTLEEYRCITLSYDNNYLPAVTWFDLEVWVGPGDAPTVVDEGEMCEEGVLEENCWEVIIDDGIITVEDVASNWIYLGNYGEEGEENKVTIRQSFHMFPEAGNEFQSDKCTFDESFKVLQTNAPHPGNVVNVDESGETLCTDGIDNDFDGFIDSADPGCCQG